MELQAGILDLVYLDLEAIEGISESACQYVTVSINCSCPGR